jgi:hypothetical protein
LAPPGDESAGNGVPGDPTSHLFNARMLRAAQQVALRGGELGIGQLAPLMQRREPLERVNRTGVRCPIDERGKTLPPIPSMPSVDLASHLIYVMDAGFTTPDRA